MTNAVAVIGIGATASRVSTPTQDFRELVYEAGKRAYTDAGITAADVDGMISAEHDFYAGLSVADEYTPDQMGMRLKFNNLVCDDGTVAFVNASMMIFAGLAEIMVVETHCGGSIPGDTRQAFLRGEMKQGAREIHYGSQRANW